ncbi:MAG TPA: hypothetical protein VEI04_13195 [Syntrophobacteria bacterium]|nr:hypothetical protein [Syntrophobacteria bacterium]
MEEMVRTELEAMRGMVLTWKKSHLAVADPNGGDEFLAEEFSDEIRTHVYPYVRRLYENNYLQESEASEFLDFCYAQVEDLLASLKAVGGKQIEAGP